MLMLLLRLILMMMIITYCKGYKSTLFTKSRREDPPHSSIVENDFKSSDSHYRKNILLFAVSCLSFLGSRVQQDSVSVREPQI